MNKSSSIYYKNKEGNAINMNIISNIGILKDMEKSGNIKLHKDTGKSILGFSGKKIKISYIQEGQPEFYHKNKLYKTVYLDGCFYPFVMSK